MKSRTQPETVTVIGGGLAGCEAAFQLASRQVPVRLVEMKPEKKSPAHHADTLAELVCSNSLRSDRLENASGLLKDEMRQLGSLVMHGASHNALPAGGALAVDRDRFSQTITCWIDKNPLIERVTRQADHIPDGIVIIATGPLTSGKLFTSIQEELGISTLDFFDAAAPVITKESIDPDKSFRQSRYSHGGDDYINCPMDKKTYEEFWKALVTAQTAPVHGFDKKAIFEGCMPVEMMAKRGLDTIRFGPLKPVGLIDPKTGLMPYACVQLRQDNRADTLYNMVGFQTRLKFSEQERVFRMIPGLERAVFMRYGVMHRNTYLPSPDVLEPDYSFRSRPALYFAGQITGVEGYVESAASGLVAGWQAALQAWGLSADERRKDLLSDQTMIGALAAYVSDPRVKRFQPMNANFGLLAPLEKNKKLRKDERVRLFVTRSRKVIGEICRRQDELLKARLQFVNNSDAFPSCQKTENGV